jgi:hypothetical protein
VSFWRDFPQLLIELLAVFSRFPRRRAAVSNDGVDAYWINRAINFDPAGPGAD